jgi:hypothetical protein
MRCYWFYYTVLVIELLIGIWFTSGLMRGAFANARSRTPIIRCSPKRWRNGLLVFSNDCFLGMTDTNSSAHALCLRRRRRRRLCDY